MFEQLICNKMTVSKTAKQIIRKPKSILAYANYGSVKSST